MCGLFGFSADDASKFSKDKFIILGILNDDRGGDSCGIYYDNIMNKSTAPPKFINFTANATPDFLVKPYILGHTRKASPGMRKTVDQAQPIVYEGHKKTDEDLISLTHNGTIYNTSELAKKYGVITDVDDTDTQILTSIILKCGFNNVLKEYQGSAAIVAYMPQKNEMYVFHGMSKSYASGVASEERPLYWLIENGYIYISSIRTSLDIIATDVTNVVEVPHNKLFTIQNGNVINELDIDRSNSSQTKFSTSVVTSYRNESTIKNVNIRKYDPYTKHSSYKNKLMFKFGNYYINDKLAHGSYKVSTNGLITTNGFKIDLYDGIMIYPGTFSILDKIIKDSIIVAGYEYSKILIDFVIGPYSIPLFNRPKVTVTDSDFRANVKLDHINHYYFSGTYYPFFTTVSYLFSVGTLKSVDTKIPFTFLSSSMYESFAKTGKEIVNTRTDINKNNEVRTEDLDDDVVIYDETDEKQVLCPECNGMSSNLGTDDSLQCDLCYNTGQIPKSEYDDYLELSNDILESAIEELELTDISLESTLFLNDVDHKLETGIYYLTDMKDALDDFSGIMINHDSKNEISKSIYSSKNSIKTIIKQLSSLKLELKNA